MLTSAGCDSKKYHDLRDKLEDTRRGKVQTLIEHWEQAEERYRLLKASDEDQAASSISGELFCLAFLTEQFCFHHCFCFGIRRSCLAVWFTSPLIVIKINSY